MSSAWILEAPKGGLCIGVFLGRLRWVSRDSAVRFDRLEDARAMADWIEHREGVTAVPEEQTWDDGSD